jgi:hypothetical protein
VLPERELLIAEVRAETAVLPVESRLEHVHRRASDEPADEEVDRAVVQLLRRGNLLKLALSHDGDAVAHRHCLDLVVRDVDGGRPEVALETSDLCPHLDAELGVQVRERLVHEEGGGLADDCPAHRDPLALAAREGSRLTLQEVLEAEDASRLLHAAVDLVLRHLLDPETERDVLVHREVRVEGVALKHHGDISILRRHVIHHSVADPEDAL